MSSTTPATIIPLQIDDFADRVLCFQNLYKDLLSAHPCAHVFGKQLDALGIAISDLVDQSRLAALYGKANTTGRLSIMSEAQRIANTTPREQ